MPSEARTAKRRTRVGDAFGVARAAWQADRHRKTGIRRHRAETEFLPAALEVLESPASPTARYTFWALVAFLLVAIGWSFVGELDVVAIASGRRSEEHTSELQSLMRISYAVSCLKKKKTVKKQT